MPAMNAVAESRTADSDRRAYGYPGDQFHSQQ